MDQNDLVIRLTCIDDETDVDHEQLKDAIRSILKLTGWKILQSGEFDSMAESMAKEKELVSNNTKIDRIKVDVK